MKKLAVILSLAVSVPALAVTNVIKPLGFEPAGESGDGFIVNTTKGDMYVYFSGLDKKSDAVLTSAVKTKSCVKVVSNKSSMETRVTKVKCPATLKPVKSLY